MGRLSASLAALALTIVGAFESTATSPTINQAPAQRSRICFGAPVNLQGANANDNVLIGRIGRDSAHGRRGDDAIFGLSGDDRLCGGRGSDTLNGGDNFDRLDGGRGYDRCSEGERVRNCEEFGR